MNRLRGAACYLAGPMTLASDLGVSWRAAIKPYLKEMGVVVLDPTDKPIEIGREGPEERAELQKMRDVGDLAGVRKFMQPIRRVDLRAVDLSSFIVVYIDGTPTMGTWEEVDTADSQRKPTLVWLDGGINRRNVNPWLPTWVPPEYIFESMEDIVEYLQEIDQSEKHPSDPRWMLFNFVELYQEIMPCMSK